MYVFLAIDGVLNTKADWKRSYTLNMRNVDDLCSWLKLQKSPTVVLISSWKRGFSPIRSNCSIQLKTLLDYVDSKVSGVRYCITRDFKYRDEEVSDFLEHHSSDSYIVLDDDISLYKKLPKNFKLINPNVGFRM